MQKENISQSLIKAFVDVKKGLECPRRFYENYISKTYPRTTSPAQALGIYFEYVATGQTPADGTIPEPKKLKSGKLATDYERAAERAAKVVPFLESHGIKIESVGDVMEVDGLKGILDIMGTDSEGRPVIVDLKYSGLIGDKWSPFGWHEDRLPHNFGHQVQALFYPLLYRKKYGVTPRFIFFVCSSKPSEDFRLFEIEIVDEYLESVSELAEWTRGAMSEVSPDPLGTFSRCSSCALSEDCPGAVKVPEIELIYLEPEF